MKREPKRMIIRRQRPSSITRLAFFELMGALSCVGFLFFIPAGSRDGIALSSTAALGFIVVYGLWTLQFWAFWFTVVYESLEIAYEVFLLTQPTSTGIQHLAVPCLGILLSAITLGYLFLDRSLKPLFRRGFPVITIHKSLEKAPAKKNV